MTRLNDLFRTTAQRDRERPAILEDGGIITFGELERRARLIAAWLRHLGVGPGDRVLFDMPRNGDAVAAMLGVLQRGAAYVPVDADLPPRRLASIVEDCRATVSVSGQERLDALGDAGIPVRVDVGEVLARGTKATPVDDDRVELDASSPAWVLYTSGSTGRPKGVIGSHAACMERVEWLWREQPFREREVCFQSTRSSVVDSFWEIFGPLGAGVPLVTISEELRRDVGRLIPTLAARGVRRICLVPSLLELIVEELPDLGRRFPILDLWVASGEPLRVDVCERFGRAAPHATLLNQYGATETVADVSSYDTRRLAPGRKHVPIGRPMGNTRFAIVDSSGSLVPPGAEGELLVAGPCLCSGYLGRPELEAERFVELALGADAPRRYFRTGDRATVGPDGEYELRGRIDGQLKVRGFRVEPGDVEAAVGRHPAVAHAAVAIEEDARGRKSLIAHAELREPVPAMVLELMAEIKARAATELPSYMVPHEVRPIARLPRTPSGKLDRSALPTRGDHPSSVTTAAEDPAETESHDPREWLHHRIEQLTGAGSDVGGDFFERGGDSLGAMRLLSDVRRRYGATISLADFYREPTADALLARIASAGPSRSLPMVRSTETVLSSDQERMWVLSLLLGDAPLYNLPFALRLTGELDAVALAAALDVAIARHEILRTVILEREGRPYASILPPQSLEIEHHDATGASDDELHQRVVALAGQPFDLSRGPLLRVALLRIGSARQLLVITCHHMVIDEWSLGSLGRELSLAYDAARRGLPPQLEPLELQYRDYAAWQRQMMVGEHLRERLSFFDRMLDGAPQGVSWPSDRPRPVRTTHAGGRLSVPLDHAKVRALVELGAAHRATPYMTLLAVYAVLLGRCTGQWDVVYGSPAANRPAETEELLGSFFNTIVLRLSLDETLSFEALVSRVRDAVLEVLARQDLPFSTLVAHRGGPRHGDQDPLFQTLFALGIDDRLDLSLEGVAAEPFPIEVPWTLVDLGLWAQERSGRFELQLEYSSELFDRQTIEQLAITLGRLIDSIVEEPSQPVAYLRIHEPSHRPIAPERSERASSWLQRFAEVCTRQPEHVAIECGPVRWTYRQLDEHSDRIAARVAHEVGAGGLVGVCASRCPSLVAAVIGVMKAGAAYLPIDGTHPAPRIHAIMERANADLILGDHVALQRTWDPSLRVLDLEAIAAEEVEGTPRASWPSPSSLAYVIYTSGSTGVPKGVEISHRALANLLDDMTRRVALCREDRWLAVTTMAFDIAALELYGPLSVGATVVLADDQTVRDVERLAALLDTSGTTVMQATPATWAMLVEAGWGGSATLRALCGGEALPPSLAQALVARCSRVWNVYGPTETTIWSCAKELGAEDDGVVTLGGPIANTTVYVLDGNGCAVPPRIPGELYIGGEGLANGYRNDPRLTAERFVPDPFGSAVGGRLYRTGDRVRMLESEELFFLGRADDQIKLRGHRIELGDIEAALRSHPRVESACVTVAGAGLDARLVAHVKPSTHDDARIELGLFFFAAERSGAYELLFDAARFADAHGLSSIWIPERHFDRVGGPYPNPAVLAAAIAAITKEVGIRAGSVVAALHDSIRIAEDWAVVDNISNGRVGMAIASGWNPRDFVFHPERYAERREVMWSQIEQVQRLWQGESITRPAGKGTATIQTFPRPVQAELPLWITSAGSPETFAQAGRAGCHVLTHLLGQSIEDLAKKIAAYRVARREAGLSPSEGKVTLMVHYFADADGERAVALCREPFSGYLRDHVDLEAVAGHAIESAEDREEIVRLAFARYVESASLIGGVDECRERVGRLASIGVDEIACLIDFGVAKDDVMRSLEHIPGLMGAAASSALLESDVAAHVGELLPSYMLPSGIIVHERFPASPNGKVDRRALAELGETIIPRAKREQTGLEGPIEQWLAALWSSLLSTEVDDADTSFFSIGGHSLFAAQIIARARKRFSVELGIRTIFEHPTIRGLAGAIEHATRGREPVAASAPASTRGPIPLLPSQAELWAFSRLHPESAAYNESEVLCLRGTVDAAALALALDRVVARHDPLRMKLVVEGGTLGQVVDEALRPRLELLDDVGEAEDARARLTRFARVPFDLSRGPLIRAALLRGEPTSYLVVVMHHAICDASSFEIVLSELGRAYGALTRGREPALGLLRASFGDYVQRKVGRLESEDARAQLAYWREQLAGAEPLRLPSDHPRRARSSFAGASHWFEIPRDVAEGLTLLGSKGGRTPFMVLMAAFMLTLSRASGRDDVSVGVPIGARDDEAFQSLVGNFLDFVVLRARVDPSATLEGFLERVQQTAIEAYANAQVPLERVLRSLGSAPRPFDVAFVLQPPLTPVFEDETLSVERLELDPGTSRFELTLSIQPLPSGSLRCKLEYSTELFEAPTMAALAAELQDVCRAMRGGSSTPLRGLLDARRAPEPRALAAESMVFERIAAQARATPRAVAVTSRKGTLTYEQLDARSSAIADHLLERGVGPESLVGLCMGRSADAVAVLLGIMKAGAAYVPIDPAYPASRIAMMLDDCRASLVVVDPESEGALGEHRIERLVASNDSPPISSSDWRKTSPPHPENLAYVIYTSGSTGRPKGVAITHRSLSHFIDWAAEYFTAKRLRVSLAATSLSFDPSIMEIFLPLTIGGKVVMVDALAQMADPSIRDEITMFIAVPSAMHALLDCGAIGRSLELIVLGSEKLPAKVAHDVLARTEGVLIHNVYGATEHTIFSTTTAVRAPVHDDPDLGQAIRGAEVLVLDTELRSVGEGEVGEVYLVGLGEARGYHGRPALTASRFVPCPHGTGRRMYRVGDLVRVRPGGALEFVGRVDQQVKIGGHRIELGEIESAMMELSSIREAAVVVQEADDAERRRLVAYFVSSEPAGTEDEVHAHLARSLPSYMVPAACIGVSDFPRLPNGKLDRGRLPVWSGRSARAEGRAARDALELQLCLVWEEVLGRPPTSVFDDFLDSGGSSLLLTILQVRIEQRTGHTIALADVLRGPSIAALAERIRATQPTRSAPLVPIREHGDGPPLVLVHPAGGNIACFGPLIRALPAEAPIYALQPGDGAALCESLAERAASYVEALTAASVPRGCVLVGYSMGGTIALEMWRRMSRRPDHEPLGVVLLDAWAPNPDLARSGRSILEFARSYGVTMGDETEQVAAAFEHARSTRALEGLTASAWIRAFETYEAHVVELASHVMEPVDAPTLLLRAREASSPGQDDGWETILTGARTVDVVEGDHHSMVHAPRAEVLAARLMTWVRERERHAARAEQGPSEHVGVDAALDAKRS